jgi:hypothetical protein
MTDEKGERIEQTASLHLRVLQSSIDIFDQVILTQKRGPEGPRFVFETELSS